MSPVLAQPARSDRSLERLYRRHAADVYRYAYAILQNRADAEDVTQTTFMNAYRALERGERPERPHNWLIAIAHNVCRQRFRHAQRRPSEVEWQEDLAEHLVEDEEAPTAHDIRRALSHLPFNQRAALVMRELEGRSYSEIADLLELSTAAVETLIFRARRALREQLEGTLTCGDAELAVSKQLDGRLSRAEKGQLRAHLRECGECASFARRQRAQRTALKSLGSIPFPASLASLFGGGGTSAGVVAAKAVAVAAAAAVAGGASYEAARTVVRPHARPHVVAPRAVVELPTREGVAVVAPLVPIAAPRHTPQPAPRRARHIHRHGVGSRVVRGHRGTHVHHGHAGAAHAAHETSSESHGGARGAPTHTRPDHGAATHEARGRSAGASRSERHRTEQTTGRDTRSRGAHDGHRSVGRGVAEHDSGDRAAHREGTPAAGAPAASPDGATGRSDHGGPDPGPPAGKHGASFSP